MMDCDTTGIEPDLALVKFKKLVGGGSMQIVNQTVPRALRNLGYQEEQVEAIVEYIAEHGHVVDAPGLKPEHYAVFDCAMGERSIAPMGHVRMMAAVQPFISGAISKTVNMPETATVEDVEKIYFEGWKLGLKALAIYRDNCKVGQPLSAPRPRRPSGQGRAAAAAEAEKVIEYRPVRKRLPKKRPSRDRVVLRRRRRGLPDRVVLPGRRPRRGLPQDVQAGLDAGRRDGRLLGGHLDRPAVRRAAGDVRRKFTNMRFEPAGMTDDPDIRMAASVMDYIFRRLALDFLPYERRAELGIFTAEGAGRPARAEAAGDGTVDLTAMAVVGAGRDAAAEAAGEPTAGGGRRGRRAGRRRLVDRAAGAGAGQGRRRAAVLHLRHEDAPGR